MREKVLVTGASGLLGREVLKALSPTAEAHGWGFSRSGGLRRVDLLNFVALEEGFRSLSPTAVVHCAAQRRPDVMERRPEEAVKLNVDATARLAELCAEAGAWLLFLSTDYLFDGSSPPYSEEAEPHPLNLYGRSKMDAEAVVRERAPRHCILRVPILYGPTSDPAESAVTVLVAELTRDPGREKSFDDAAIRYPTLTTDVAAAIAFLLGGRAEGTFHCSAEDPFTKYGMAVVMARAMGLPAGSLFPDSGPQKGARRPLNAHLNNTKLRRLGFHSYTPFREAIGAVLAAARGR